MGSSALGRAGRTVYSEVNTLERMKVMALTDWRLVALSSSGGRASSPTLAVSHCSWVMWDWIRRRKYWFGVLLEAASSDIPQGVFGSVKLLLHGMLDELEGALESKERDFAHELIFKGLAVDILHETC